MTGRRVAAQDLEFSRCGDGRGQQRGAAQSGVELFRPGVEYRIYLTYLGTTRWITGELTAFKAPSGPVGRRRPFRPIFVHKAFLAIGRRFWPGHRSHHALLGISIHGSPDLRGAGGGGEFCQEVVFDYDGDVPSYFKATITCDGPVTNPRLTGGDGYVRILTGMQPGDVLTIDFEAARVQMNGENILARWIAPAAFSHENGAGGKPGQLFSGCGENGMHVVLYYNKQYLGV